MIPRLGLAAKHKSRRGRSAPVPLQKLTHVQPLPVRSATPQASRVAAAVGAHPRVTTSCPPLVGWLGHVGLLLLALGRVARFGSRLSLRRHRLEGEALLHAEEDDALAVLGAAVAVVLLARLAERGTGRQQ